MSLPCPYCQSRDTVLLESPQHLVINSHSPSAQNNVMSPLALATLGISVSKSLNIPPIAGALVGVLIGGIWMLVPRMKSKTARILFIPDIITAMTVTAILVRVSATNF